MQFPEGLEDSPYKIINIKKSLSFNNKENLLFSCYDIIMELRELSELIEDYIAEMLTKLGLLMR